LQINLGNNLIFDISYKILIQDGVKVKLTLNELSLLELFIKNRNRMMSTHEIKTNIWENEYASDGALKSLLHKLRKKIGKDTIISTSGVGFKIIIQNNI
jgi:DNA-binding response OmpR family regulator